MERFQLISQLERGPLRPNDRYSFSLRGYGVEPEKFPEALQYFATHLNSLWGEYIHSNGQPDSIIFISPLVETYGNLSGSLLDYAYAQSFDNNQPAQTIVTYIVQEALNTQTMYYVLPEEERIPDWRVFVIDTLLEDAWMFDILAEIPELKNEDFRAHISTLLLTDITYRWTERLKTEKFVSIRANLESSIKNFLQNNNRHPTLHELATQFPPTDTEKDQIRERVNRFLGFNVFRIAGSSQPKAYDPTSYEFNAKSISSHNLDKGLTFFYP